MNAKEIESQLRAIGDPVRAEHDRAYLKSPDGLEHLGITVPILRRQIKPVAKAIERHDELMELARALWRRPVYDLRAFAALMLDARPELIWASDFPRIKEFVRTAGTWALVDPLSYDLLGKVLVAHRTWATRIDSWAQDESLWVRRAALLSQAKPLKAGGSFDRFSAYADAMLEEREFFIRKAIGWVLRETGKSRPDEVYDWLLPRAHRASGVTITEATKYLYQAQQHQIRAAGSHS